jgi:thiopeptide-type bacteriocin biosynthesis protein
MSTSLQFHPKLIIRTPNLPFSDDISEAFLKDFLENPTFCEALYLASPVLLTEAINWKEGRISDPKKSQKVITSLSKYYSRMRSRCTPFGLFAGCGILDWQNPTAEIEIQPNEVIKAAFTQRNTRLDMHYAGALAQRLAEIPEIKSALLYYPNSSIYQVGGEIRYIEYKYINGRRTHQISAIDWSEYIQKVIHLCKSGISIADIIPHIIEEDISEEDAIDFIHTLIEEQLLVNELEPAITGEEFTQQLIKVISKIPTQSFIKNLLAQIQAQLEKIDAQPVNSLQAYQDIIELIKPFGIPYEEGKLFQTDLVQKYTHSTISVEYQNSLKTVVDTLVKLSKPVINPLLKKFISQFHARYETRELPLLTVLDTERGIGYGKEGGNHTPLADGLVLPNLDNKTNAVSYDDLQKFLFQKQQKALQSGTYEVIIEQEELRPFFQVNQQLPPSTALMFRLTGDQQRPISIQSFGGSSAVNLLGRFSHADSAVLGIIKQITSTENNQNPAVILAEIVHLPENRIGNIILHPSFRPYEIPYLAKSSLPIEQQLTLDDLVVSVNISTEKVTLRSKKHNKEVIPRLSNAHNYSSNAQPLYHFLCDLQTQQVNHSFNLPWDALIPFSQFSPRLTYQNVILSVATWHFNREDLSTLSSEKSETLIEKMNEFREKWQVPRLFVYAQFDNELLVNAENLLSIQTFIDAIRNNDTITLKEFFFNPETSPIKDAQNNGFCNQIIASLINTNTTYQGIKANDTKENTIQRDFSLGTEWLYFKFYIGTKSADTLLTQLLKPLTEQLLAAQLINQWFFIRYSDPDKHIRFRVKLNDLQALGQVILAIQSAVNPLEAEGIIWKTQVDTYQREIERYGADSIVDTETIFFHDSINIVDMLEQTWGDEREHIRGIWCMKSIDCCLNDFGLSLSEKMNLLQVMKDSFAHEFKMDKKLKIQLDQRFREHRKQYEQLLDNNPAHTHEYAQLLELLAIKSSAIQAAVAKVKQQKDEISLRQYLFAIIHMTVNRAISDSQRLHELVIYDFMFRYYQAAVAKSKKQP